MFSNSDTTELLGRKPRSALPNIKALATSKLEDKDFSKGLPSAWRGRDGIFITHEDARIQDYRAAVLEAIWQTSLGEVSTRAEKGADDRVGLTHLREEPAQEIVGFFPLAVWKGQFDVQVPLSPELSVSRSKRESTIGTK
ncbi:hypothetical protein FALBO_7472 [Fusarium albosuccineum]|uniref:Uncharacterized protein n=1 Tax=Fusarium albosuccineum TaxID=1237068 RepID=A0A8H4PDP8_9HYPO|nr:hypothetical protein FALBO_7472 [Fusarium albosuccineum]